MNLDFLTDELENDESAKQNQSVSIADVLAALVLIQGQLSTIEKKIDDNEKKRQKDFAELKKMLEAQDKNISAMPVLTANIISEKVDKIVPAINAANDTLAKSITGLNESNAAFDAYLKTWIVSMLIMVCIILYLVFFK